MALGHLFGLWISLVGTGATGPEPRMLTSRTVVEAGGTRYIPFGCGVAETGQSFTVRTGDPAIVLALTDGTVLAGQFFGFVRVQGVAPGETTLRIGESQLLVRVLESGGEAAGPPRIVGPAPGACVWGEVWVSVEVAQQPGGPERDCILILGNGTEIEAAERSSPGTGPWRSFAFQLHTTPIHSATLELTPVVRSPGLTDRRGQTVVLCLAKPSPADIIAGEAEARHECARPERFKEDRQSVGRDAAASGGAYFSNAGAEPALCFPVEVSSAGMYQMMLVASGSRAGGALPTVGLVIDGANQPATNGRLITTGWHRVAIGVPVRLEAGTRILTPYFANDFYAEGLADRNLRIDRVEVLRIADAGDAATESGSPMMGVMGAMTAMSSGGISAMNGGGSTGATDPYGLSGAPLRVAFNRPLQNVPVSGELYLEGNTWWDDAQKRPVPRVTLLVNGEPVAHQFTGHPKFRLSTETLAPGVSVQMLARTPGGAVATTPIERLELAHKLDATSPDRRFLRYTVHEPGWDEAARALHTTAQHGGESRSIGFASQAAATFMLPDHLEGRFRIGLESHGQAFDGPPLARLTLVKPEGEIPLGEIEVLHWWDTRATEAVDLTAGPKSVRIEFVNDKYEQGVGDRNMYVQAVVLDEATAEPDTHAPVGAILYPPPGHAAYMHDAVVIACADDRAVEYAELLIDEVESGRTVAMRDKPGRWIIPLLLRGIDPGEHTLTVRFRDEAGNDSQTDIRPFTVLASPPERPGPYERAVRLLDRMAFGPDALQLAEVLTVGEQAWLVKALTADGDEPADAAALGIALSHFPNPGSEYEVPRRAIEHAVQTPNPVRARFVLWAENHFSTWIRKTEPRRKWAEHAAFAQLGPARFDRLLRASATGPAMLRYLDQEQSFSGRLNENYAREIMELHTVGVDAGYTQADVTSLARILTGWMTSREGDGHSPGEIYDDTFRFDPALSDGSEARLFGVAFSGVARDQRYDRALAAVESLAAHPATAHSISTKLVEHYIAAPAPAAAVDHLTGVFLETGGDMKAMLLAIAQHPDFWSAPARLAKPLDFAVRLQRTSRWNNPWETGDFLQRSGNGLFDRPTPDGYPEEDSAYTDSNAMVQRWRFAHNADWAIAGLVPNHWRYNEDMPQDLWAQRVTDAIAVGLTGRTLSDSSNAAALTAVKAMTGSRDDRTRQLGLFIAKLPEVNLK